LHATLHTSLFKKGVKWKNFLYWHDIILYIETEEDKLKFRRGVYTPRYKSKIIELKKSDRLPEWQ